MKRGEQFNPGRRGVAAACCSTAAEGQHEGGSCSTASQNNHNALSFDNTVKDNAMHWQTRPEKNK